jgi:hypothetical protein
VPELIVETNLELVTAKRRLAKAVAVFMHREGVPLAHSIVRFRHTSDAEVFSGPYPFATVADGEEGAFAFVTCRIARTRGADFRQALATVVADALVPPVALERLFVAFEPVDPANHYRGPEIAQRKEEPAHASAERD